MLPFICLLSLPFARASDYVVTIAPLRMIVQEIVGNSGSITQLLPAGVSAHTYEPKPSDLRAAQSALLIYVADNLDGWAANLAAAKKIGILALVPHQLLLPPYETGQQTKTEHPSGEADPHVWMDPLLVRIILPTLTDKLCEFRPQKCDLFRANSARFKNQLDDLNGKITQLLAPVRGRPVILFHPSLRYFLRRYDLRMAKPIEPSPGKEPSPKYLQELTKEIKDSHIRVIFSEPQLPKRPAEALAKSTGARISELDPLGGSPGHDTYADLMLYNARTLLEGLR